jgi:hypothetical protein
MAAGTVSGDSVALISATDARVPRIGINFYLQVVV